MTHIKKASLDDLDALTDLFDGYRVFYKKESDLKRAKKFLNDRIQNNESEIFLAVNETGLATGFVQLYPIFSSTRMKRFWLLNDLFVHPNFRGLGISKALIEKAKELCISTGGCGMMLETAKTNHIGNILYPKAGFILNTDFNLYIWEHK